MDQSHRETIGLLFSLAIIVLSAVVIKEFILPLTWAGVLAIATWPVYRKFQHLTAQRSIISALLLVALIAILMAIPFLWLSLALASEIQTFSNFIVHSNTHGIPFPAWIDHIPHAAAAIKPTWNDTLGKPHGLASILTNSTHLSMKPMTTIAKSLGSQVVHRVVALGFTLLCLFFFYKDGDVLRQQLNAMGKYFLQTRWQLYSESLPGAINATVNGLVLVGLGIGIIMGSIYAFAGVPAPVLFGALTGLLAIIPFAVLIAFGIVSILLLIEGKLLAMLVIVITGTTVMFIADHFVRPAIIGGATRLPFLAVLFGILGGVKTFGVIGLFLGPIIMVLFITLWHEVDLFA